LASLFDSHDLESLEHRNKKIELKLKKIKNILYFGVEVLVLIGNIFTENVFIVYGCPSIVNRTNVEIIEFL